MEEHVSMKQRSLPYNNISIFIVCVDHFIRDGEIITELEFCKSGYMNNELSLAIEIEAYVL